MEKNLKTITIYKSILTTNYSNTRMNDAEETDVFYDGEPIKAGSNSPTPGTTQRWSDSEAITLQVPQGVFLHKEHGAWVVSVAPGVMGNDAYLTLSIATFVKKFDPKEE